MIDMPIVEFAAGAVGAILAALAVLYFARKQADRKIAQARIDFDEENAHNAKYDAEATAALFCRIVNASGFEPPT